MKSIVYEPNHIIKAGNKIWLEMARELFDSRGLIWRLFLRDLQARFKQTFLGVIWAFLSPLILMFLFVWMKQKQYLPIAEPTAMPYAAFVLYGQMIWLIFSQGLGSSTGSLVNAGGMITKINFPREVLVFCSLGHTLFDFLVRIPLLVIIFFWVDFLPNPMIALTPFILFPLLLLVTGLGFIFSLLNTLIRDIGNFLGIILNLGIFVTPVFYPPPTDWPLSFFINHCNPISAYITAARDICTLGIITEPLTYFSSCILGISFFLLGWRLFHLLEPKIAEMV